MRRRSPIRTSERILLLAGFCLDPVAAAAPPAQPAPPVRAAADANGAFALDLYARLRERPGNLFLSPLSISAALAMTSAGARGETLREMEKVLHLGPGPSAHAGFGDLLRQLQPKEDSYELSIANALWIQKGYPVREEFRHTTGTEYGAGLESLDFANEPGPARATINRWVEERTRSRIRDLMPPESVTARTRLVLTNAIYFKGKWQRPFPKAATQDEPFQAQGGSSPRVPLMRAEGSFAYLDAGDAQVVALPYGNGDLSMVLLLPRAKEGLLALEASLTTARLSEWLQKLATRPGTVMLPRYRVTAQFELKDTLAALGMRRAFGDAADFSGIASGERLLISAVVHKAYVDVNEEGSEAAAATGVAMMPTSMPLAPPERFTFRADHPFLFLIRDVRSGSLLFLGRVVNPAS
jgi:serpin B